MRVALITGASRGIGRAVVEELARDHLIYVGATTHEGAAEVADKLPDATPFVADLSDPQAIRAAVEEAGITELDTVVHAAGIGRHKRVEDTSWSDWQETFSLNLFGIAELTRHLLPALRARRGTVITLNSGSGYHSGATGSLYSGAKFALRAFTDALREEELGRIRVTSLHPGRVNTDMQRELRRHEGIADEDYDGHRWVRPESIADAVRLVVDLGEDATIKEMHVHPTGMND